MYEPCDICGEPAYRRYMRVVVCRACLIKAAHYGDEWVDARR